MQSQQRVTTNNDVSNNNTLNLLPEEMLFHLFGFLGTKEWIAIARTNKFFYKFITSYCQTLLSSKELGINDEVTKKLKKEYYSYYFYEFACTSPLALLTTILRIPRKERQQLTAEDLEVLSGCKDTTRTLLTTYEKHNQDISQYKVILYLLLSHHRRLAEKIALEFELVKGSDRKKILIKDLDLSSYDLSQLDLNRIHFTSVKFSNCHFIKTNLDHTHFESCTLHNVNFSEARLIKNNFTLSSIIKINLTGATIIHPKHLSLAKEYNQIIIDMPSLDINKRIQYVLFVLQKHYEKLASKSSDTFFKFHLDIKGIIKTLRYIHLFKNSVSQLQQKIVVYALLSHSSKSTSGLALQKKVLDYLDYAHKETALLELKNSIMQDFDGDIVKQFEELHKTIIIPLNGKIQPSKIALSYHTHDSAFWYSQEVADFKKFGIESAFKKTLTQRVPYFTDEIIAELKDKILKEICALPNIKSNMFMRDIKNQNKFKFYGEMLERSTDVMSVLIILRVLLNDIHLQQFHSSITLCCNELLNQFLKLKPINKQSIDHFQQIIEKGIKSKLEFDIDKINNLDKLINELNILIAKEDLGSCQNLLENIHMKISDLAIVDDRYYMELKSFK